MERIKNVSNDKIEEALDLLSLAAKEKKMELGDLISERYSNLKDLLFDGSGSLAESLSETAKHVSHSVREVGHKGQKKVNDVVERIQEDVHTRPWSFIGGAALGALILGFVFGRRKQSPESK